MHPDRGEEIACASDKRTIHVWQVGNLASSTGNAPGLGSKSASNKGKGREQPPPISNSTNLKGISNTVESAAKALNYLKPYLPAYFSSQWSDLTWRIPHNASTTFHPAHVAALAEQDDIATCMYIQLDEDKETKHSRGKFRKQRLQELQRDTHHLVIITRSGAWFRLSMEPAPPPPIAAARRNKKRREKQSGPIFREENKENLPYTQDRHRQQQSDKTDRSPPLSKTGATASPRDANQRTQDEKKCRLVEYKRLGYGSDNEINEEQEDRSDLEFSSDSDE